MSKKVAEIHPTIWKDRRRRLGLPLSFTRYYIRNTRLYLRVGFFSVTENELLLYRILDLKMRQSFFDKIFGVGTITLYTCDETDKELILYKIKKPSHVRDLISTMVEEERAKLNIRGREIAGVVEISSHDCNC